MASGRRPSRRRGNGGLGTAIVQALVKQLDALMEVVRAGPAGMKVSITRANFASRIADAAAEIALCPGAAGGAPLLPSKWL